VLPAACRRLTKMKYRIDDVMDALWRRPDISAAVLRDPLFQLLGISGAALVPDGVDWLEAVARYPGIDDDLWLAQRTAAVDDDGSLLYAIAPHSFARLVLPSEADGRQYRQFMAEDMALAQIDPSLVVGGTYQRGWPAVPSARELDLINAKAAAAPPGLDTAYVRVGRLPLYVAVEGKNRVRAFRAAGKAITGFTCTARFPDPEALELHEIADRPGADSCRAVSSGTAAPDVVVSDESGAVQVLPLPCVTVPVLQAYGVRWGRTLPSDTADRGGRPLSAGRRPTLEDLVRHFMHP
jgi:hypothetical protein